MRLVGINLDNARYAQIDRGTVLGDVENRSLSEYISVVANSLDSLKKLKKSELVHICGLYAISSVGSKAVLAERIWSESTKDEEVEPISRQQVLVNGVVGKLDAHLYHKPMKGTEYTESGQANENGLLRAAAQLFAEGESERLAMGMAPGEKLVFVCERGLAQSRYCHKMLFSPDGVGVTWRPRTEAELEEFRQRPEFSSSSDEEDAGVFSVVLIECKTIHGGVLSNRLARMARFREGKYFRTYLPGSDLRPLEDALNVMDDDASTTDTHRFQGGDLLMSVIGNRSHVCQLLSLCAASGVPRVLYVIGSPNRALQMVDMEQEMSTRRNVDSRLGFTMCHGAPDRRWPVWGIVCSHFVMKVMREGGARVLFDNEGDGVPDAVEELSYVQNRVARMQQAQLRDSALTQALAQREPLPSMKYIRASAVYAWNSIGKAGVDESSKKANSLMPSSLPADIACRLCLRVVSMQLINALQIWRISFAGRALLRPRDASTLTEMRRKMSGGVTPRQFLATCLMSRGLSRLHLTRPVPPAALGGERNVAETFVRNGICAPIESRYRAFSPPDLPDLVFTKKSFIEFFNSEEGRTRRLSKKFSQLGCARTAIVEGMEERDRMLHTVSVPADLKGTFRNTDPSRKGTAATKVQGKYKSRRNCFLCNAAPSRYATRLRSGDGEGEEGDQVGELCEWDEGDDCANVRVSRVPCAPETRVQCKTKYVCVDCGGIFLCRVKRWKKNDAGDSVLDQLSCWEKFHSYEVIGKVKYVKPPSATQT